MIIVAAGLTLRKWFLDFALTVTNKNGTMDNTFSGDRQGVTDIDNLTHDDELFTIP